ncbi:lamin tail domain-containing protein [Methanoregula sp.]|uniref:lamin tail domain-containing protein n=1 Tax=Methanoregula sp. TaxID=2052170 RepID=UPI003C74FAC1
MDTLKNPLTIFFFLFLILVITICGCTERDQTVNNSSPGTVTMTGVAPQHTFISPPSHTSDLYKITISDFFAGNDSIRISNSGTTAVSMSGWILKTKPGNFTFIFPAFSLENGKSVTVFLNKTGQNTQEELFATEGGAGRNISTIALYDAQGNLMIKTNRTADSDLLASFGDPVNLQEIGINSSSDYYELLQKVTNESDEDLERYYYPAGPVFAVGYDENETIVEINNDWSVNETTIEEIYRVIERHGEENGIKNIPSKFLSLGLMKMESK